MVKLLAIFLLLGSTCLAGDLPNLIPLDQPLPMPPSMASLQVVRGDEAVAKVKAHLASIVKFDSPTSSTVVQIIDPDFRVEGERTPKVYTEFMPGVIVLEGGALNLVAVGIGTVTEESLKSHVGQPLDWYDTRANPLTQEKLRRRWPQGADIPSPTILGGDRLFNPVGALLLPESLPNIRGMEISIVEQDTGRLRTMPQPRGWTNRGTYFCFSSTLVPGRATPLALQADWTEGEPESYDLTLRKGEVICTPFGVVGVIDPWADFAYAGPRPSIPGRAFGPGNVASPVNGCVLAIYPQSAAEYISIDTPQAVKPSGRHGFGPAPADVLLTGVPLAAPVKHVTIRVPAQQKRAVFRLEKLPVPLLYQDVIDPWDVEILYDFSIGINSLQEITQSITGYNTQVWMTSPSRPAPSDSSLVRKTLGDVWRQELGRTSPRTVFEVDNDKHEIYLGPPRPSFAMKGLWEMLR